MIRIILFYYTTILILFSASVQAIENKILIKVNNEIITSIDIENESRYLLTLNKDIKNLSKKRILEISKNSIIKEKIKKNELLKNFQKIEIKDEYLEHIFKNIYIKLGILNLSDFKIYLSKNDINFQNVKEKIKIEALWNELIYMKFSKKIKINENNLREKILQRKKKKSKSFLMSEIFFQVNKMKDLDSKYLEIKNIIDNEGFNNAALTYSISDTSNIGGKLGWINQETLNPSIIKEISKLKINEYTKPIPVSSGFLILKINEIKYIKNNLDVDLELKNLIRLETNKQLNQFSVVYFNKAKKNVQINEY